MLATVEASNLFIMELEFIYFINKRLDSAEWKDVKPLKTLKWK